MRAPMYGGVPAKDLGVEADTLQKFKDRVDGILQELEGSAASRTNMADQNVARTSFGGSFSEADDLFTQYNRVHELLTHLSKTLSDQVEAIGIAVLGAKNGFQSLDDDVKRRFWQIQTGAQNRYQEQQQEQRQQEQAEQQRMGGDKPAAPAPGDGKQGEGFE